MMADKKSQVCIRKTIGARDFPRLVEIWGSAVEATHSFLAEDDRVEIESRLVTHYFPQVDLYVAERGGVPLGFAGVFEEKLEMLFVDADKRGQGIGSALMSYVVDQLGVDGVDVNEQNAQAVEFYRRRGFVVAARSAVDDQGRPYPLLHMKIKR